MLNDELGREGSYSFLMEKIKSGIIERIKQERDAAGPKANFPSSVNGKPVLPATEEAFVVRVTNRQGETVCYLYNWKDLYLTAFYVESEDADQQCWYYFIDMEQAFNVSRLPPKSQFHYTDGKGLFELPVTATYEGLGRKRIMLGPDAIDSYVHNLFIIRKSLGASGRKRLKMTAALYSELKKGPFSFGAVVISEPTRFAEYQQYMISNIMVPERVPERFSDCFTEWCKISKKLFSEEPFTENEVEGSLRFTREEVQRKIAIMCRGDYLQTDIAEYKGAWYNAQP